MTAAACLCGGIDHGARLCILKSCHTTRVSKKNRHAKSDRPTETERATERRERAGDSERRQRNRLRHTVVHALESANSNIEAGFKHKHAACGPGMGKSAGRAESGKSASGRAMDSDSSS